MKKFLLFSSVLLVTLLIVLAISLIVKPITFNGKTQTYKNYYDKSEETYVLYIKRDGCSSCEEIELAVEHYINNGEYKMYILNLSNLDAKERTQFLKESDISGTPTMLLISKNRFNNRVVKTKAVGSRECMLFMAQYIE